MKVRVCVGDAGKISKVVATASPWYLGDAAKREKKNKRQRGEHVMIRV